MVKCKICSAESFFKFTKKILGKYEVSYFKCSNCQFIQTEHSYWLNESYENIITRLDIGLLNRNLYLVEIARSLINAFFDPNSNFLDFGGGYGIFVRLMRDNGFRFYRQDYYCENLFAKSFDITDIKGKFDFELVTSFEVFEHLVDPLEEISEMLEYSNSILFSTELQSELTDLDSWEYLAPETGQHISFYSLNTLKEVARHFKLNLYTNNKNIHLLTSKNINPKLFRFYSIKKVAAVYNYLKRNKSLLLPDYTFIKNNLKDEDKL